MRRGIIVTPGRLTGLYRWNGFAPQNGLETVNIFEMIRQGLRIAGTSRALWLYGFFVGLGMTGETVKTSHGPGAPAAAHILPHAFSGGLALLAIAIVVFAAAGVFMYFLSEGALIEGVARIRRGMLPTARGGWRDGLAHWGVLFRIGVIYFAIAAGSTVLLVAPSLLALKFVGTALAVMLAIPAALIAVPWLATLYMWRAFAERIAVLENRHARDAAGRARLFLHGRLFQGLSLIIAAFLGRLVVMLVGSIGIVPIALAIVIVVKVYGMMPPAIPVIVLGAMVLLPILFVLLAISGTTQSSIWTIGYMAQQQP